MRRKTSTRTKNFGSVTLYRDSIDEITTLLHSNLYAPQLGDKQFEYDTVEELLTERGEVLRDLTITGAGNDSDVNIQISWRLGSKLEVVNNDALFLTISDLLKKHHRNYLYFGLMLVSFLFLASYFALATLGAGKWILVSMAGLGITFGSFIGCHEGWFSRVCLTRRHQTSSFWKRNNDAVIIAIISSLLSAILSFIVAYFLFRGGIK